MILGVLSTSPLPGSTMKPLNRQQSTMPAGPTPPTPPPMQRDDTDDGLRLLHRHHQATLQHLERRAEVRFVIDPGTGELVFPVEQGFAAAPELVLHMPDEVQSTFELAVVPKVIERPEADGTVDRWTAYHGQAGALPTQRGGMKWVRAQIDAGKRPRPGDAGEVYSASVLQQPNPLRATEFKLIKKLNGDRPLLASMCRGSTGVEVIDPLCVGIDSFGMDIRARFGILRLEFELEAATADQAEEWARRLASQVPKPHA